MKKISKAHEHALNIINTLWDAYEEYTEEDIKELTEEQAKKFVEGHIGFVIAVNGQDENGLWYTELIAIKELNLYDKFGLDKQTIEDMLENYEE